MSAETNDNAAPKQRPIKWSAAVVLDLGRTRERPLPENLPVPVHYGPLFVGPVPQLDPAQKVSEWVRGLNKIQPSKRNERARYILDAFTDLAAQEANRAAIVARAIVASQHLADDGYWRETAMWGREFKSGDELVQALLEEFGVMVSVDRLRHQRPAARLFLEAEALGLPLPRCLSALEPFCHYGVINYKRAVERYNRAPSETVAREYCEALRENRLPGEPRQRQQSAVEVATERVAKALENFREQAQASPDPQFLAFFGELQAAHLALAEASAPKVKAPRPSAESALPKYTGPESQSPVSITIMSRDGGYHILVSVIALPPPCPKVLTRRAPASRGWCLIIGENGSFAWERMLPSNPSEAHARLGEAHRWASRACIQVCAKIPSKPSLPSEYLTLNNPS